MSEEPPIQSRRPVQTSLLPDVPDRALGPILPSVITGTNAELIAAVAPIYLTGSVCDVTYGVGGWWRRFTPDPFTAHDLDPEKGDGVDFTALPEADNTYDAVTYDPPYVPVGANPGIIPGDRGRQVSFHDRFGIGVARTDDDVARLIAAGLAECARVSRRWVLVKCGDYVKGAGLTLGHVRVIDQGAKLGLTVHDLIIHHTGSGPGGHNIVTVKRARRHHSYLIVFTL